MRWLVYLELQGFYATVLGADLVLREGRVFDASAVAYAQGVRPGMSLRQAEQSFAGASSALYDALQTDTAAKGWWGQLLALTPWVETISPHQAFIGLGGGAAPPLAEVTGLLRGLGHLAWAGVATSKLLARAAVLAAQFGGASQPVPTYGGQGMQAGNSRGGFYRAGASVGTGAGAGAGRGADQFGAVAGDRLIVVPPGQEASFLAPQPIGVLWPAEFALLRRLGQLGLNRVADLVQIKESELLRQFGPQGRQLARWARGIDQEPLRVNFPLRELSWSHGFVSPPDRIGLEALLGQQLRELVQELVGGNEGCQGLSLTLEAEGGRRVVADRTFRQPEYRPAPLETILRQLLVSSLNELAEPPVAIRLALTQLVPMAWQQLDLLTMAGNRQRDKQLEKLEGVLDHLRARFPPRLAGLGASALRPVPRREKMLAYVDPYRWSAHEPAN